MSWFLQNSREKPNPDRLGGGVSVEQADAELTTALNDLNNTLNVNLLELYALEKSRGRDTSEIEAKLKKYGIPIPR